MRPEPRNAADSRSNRSVWKVQGREPLIAIVLHIFGNAVVPMDFGIDVRRGLRGAALAAVVGLGLALLPAVVFPSGYLWAPAIITLFAFSGWCTYAPHGQHRFTAALAVLLLGSWIVADGAAVGLTRQPRWYATTLAPICAQLVLAAIITAGNAFRARRKIAEPIAGSDGG
jgi:hypothetical protein